MGNCTTKAAKDFRRSSEKHHSTEVLAGNQCTPHSSPCPCFQAHLHASTGTGIFFGICLVIGVVAFIGYSYLRFRKQSTAFQHFKVRGRGVQSKHSALPRPHCAFQISGSKLSSHFIKLELQKHCWSLYAWTAHTDTWQRLPHLTWELGYFACCTTLGGTTRAPALADTTNSKAWPNACIWTKPVQTALSPEMSALGKQISWTTYRWTYSLPLPFHGTANSFIALEVQVFDREKRLDWETSKSEQIEV